MWLRCRPRLPDLHSAARRRPASRTPRARRSAAVPQRFVSWRGSPLVRVRFSTAGGPTELAALSHERPFLESCCRAPPDEATWLILRIGYPEASQLRDSAGFTPDFAAPAVRRRS